MAAPTGFTYEVQGAAVVVFHHGRRAATLRGGTADRFLEEVERGGDAQELLARATGNYKRGNERAGKQHPRHD